MDGEIEIVLKVIRVRSRKDEKDVRYMEFFKWVWFDWRGELKKVIFEIERIKDFNLWGGCYVSFKEYFVKCVWVVKIVIFFKVLKVSRYIFRFFSMSWVSCIKFFWYRICYISNVDNDVCIELFDTSYTVVSVFIYYNV